MVIKGQDKKKQLRVIDLFAGVGGFRVGLERANRRIGKNVFRFVWGNQWEPGIKRQHAAEIYKKRFKVSEKDFVNDDISKVKVADIPNHDVMVAGFPCQDYSVATTKKLSKGIGGKKGVLWWQLERILREKGKHSPNYFIFENVDRLLNSPASQRGRDFAIMLTCLNNLEYMVEWRVIDASTYGFPQRRKRVFFVGYKKGTKPYERFNGEKEKVVDWLSMEGIFAQGFPIKRLIEQDIVEIDPLPSRKDTLEERRRDVKKISDLFNKGKMKSPFLQSGLMKNGWIFTARVTPNYKGVYKTLGDILLKEEQVPGEFFIPNKDLGKWKYLKGSKKEKRVSSSTGHEYFYSEGAITYPDDPLKPSRTIITGEGGPGPSRFKHVIRTASGRLRRLTPLELERLDMFDDNHTEMVGVSDSKRAFLMGNALVVGVIQRIGEYLYKNIK